MGTVRDVNELAKECEEKSGRIVKQMTSDIWYERLIWPSS